MAVPTLPPISIPVPMCGVKWPPIQCWHHWPCLHSTAVPGDGSHYHHMFFTLLSSKQISFHPKELPQRNIPRASQVRNLDHCLAVSRLTAWSGVFLSISLTPLLLFKFTLSNWGASRFSSKKRSRSLSLATVRLHLPFRNWCKPT